MGKRIVRGLLVAFGVFVAIGVVAVIDGRNDEKKSNAETPAPESKAAPAPKVDVRTATPVDVTLPVLFADYKANAVAADAKYRGKVLRVTAIVGRVGKNSLGAPYLALNVGGDPDGFRATFATEEGLAAIKPADTAVMRCRLESAANLLTLDDCVID